MRKIALAAAIALAASATAPAIAATAVEPPAQEWSFDGVFGTFDRNQLKRGFQVFREVCSACHSLKLVAFRNLKDPGGPEFTEAEAKAIAAGFQVPSLDDTGQPTTRDGILADHFPLVYPNDIAAHAANNGAAPPDLSLMAKARENGPDYIHAIMVGFHEAPEGFTVPEGAHYNEYMPGHVIAMASPLTDGQVEYAEANVPRTVDQYGKDVAAFLMWAAEPKLEARHRLGMGVIIFLSLLSVLLFLSYRRVWRNIDH